MSKAPRLRAQWDGEAFVVRPNQIPLADKHFVVGESYWITEHEERSMKSHRHFFKAVAKAWENIPDEWAERFPTPEHLRKYILVRLGYRTEDIFVCKDAAEAKRWVLNLRKVDDYAVFHLEDNVITRWQAKSQDKRTMKGGEFQQSKNDVFGYLQEKFGIDPELLKAYADHDT